MLLEAIVTTGSIAAAQRRLGSSYAQVWKLVAAMNETFSPPLVSRLRGGAGGGGAILTGHGRKVLGSYRRLERLSRARGHAELRAIGRAACHANAKQRGGDAHIVGYGQTQPGSTDTVESGRLDTTLAAGKYLFALDQACAEK